MSEAIRVNFSDPASKADFLRRLSQLRGDFIVDLKRVRANRTQGQNALYWSVYVPAFQRALRDHGEVISQQLAHDLLKHKFLATPLVNPRTGEQIGVRTRSTTELDTKEFSQYLEDIEQWLANDFGVVMPGRSSQAA